MKYCDICGHELSKKIYGFSFSASAYGYHMNSRLVLCSCCSTKLRNYYEQAVNTIHREALRIYKDPDEKESYRKYGGS